MDQEQREFFDNLDAFTEQSFISIQYASLVLRRLRQWKSEGRPVGPDALTSWAREREHRELDAGTLAGLAIAIQAEDHVA